MMEARYTFYCKYNSCMLYISYRMKLCISYRMKLSCCWNAEINTSSYMQELSEKVYGGYLECIAGQNRPHAEPTHNRSTCKWGPCPTQQHAVCGFTCGLFWLEMHSAICGQSYLDGNLWWLSVAYHIWTAPTYRTCFKDQHTCSWYFFNQLFHFNNPTWYMLFTYLTSKNLGRSILYYLWYKFSPSLVMLNTSRKNLHRNSSMIEIV